MTWILTEAIIRSKLTIREAFNLLQLNGAISDNTIHTGRNRKRGQQERRKVAGRPSV